jgi:predicted dehydrogenase
MAARPVRIGLIGAGGIARCHVYGYRALPACFPDSPGRPILESVAEVTPELAEQAARRLGFSRAARDWRAIVADPAIDVIDICVPSNLHREIALAAISAGKTVYCEKPIGLSGKEAREIAEAAARAGVGSLTGYTYLRNPLVRFARKLIDDGAIGTISLFRGTHNEDYLADPATAFSWRCDPAVAGRAGALGDVGSHIISLALHLVGGFAEVVGATKTVIAERPDQANPSRRRPVGNDDQATALVKFASGAAGYVETSRVASGSKMAVGYEIIGSKGALRFDGERGGELQFYDSSDPRDRLGFKRIYASAAHPPFGQVSPGPAHGLSFNDHKTIEINELMHLAAAGEAPLSDLATGARVGAVIDAILESVDRGGWATVRDKGVT